jgi:hypothetical protein
VERLSERLAEAETALASFNELVHRTDRSVVERDAAIILYTVAKKRAGAPSVPAIL